LYSPAGSQWSTTASVAASRTQIPADAGPPDGPPPVASVVPAAYSSAPSVDPTRGPGKDWLAGATGSHTAASARPGGGGASGSSPGWRATARTSRRPVAASNRYAVLASAAQP